MLNIRRYSRENPIAFRLLGLIVVSSSLITLFAILLQLYGNFHDDVSSLEKRLDQVRISTLASITKSLWGFDQEQLSIQIHSVLDVTDVVQVRGAFDASCLLASALQRWQQQRDEDRDDADHHQQFNQRKPSCRRA